MGYIKKSNIQGILGYDDSAIQKTHDFWTDLANCADINDDGKIDYSQFKHQMKQMMHKRASLYIKKKQSRQHT